jgi:hypothetical protein
MARMCTVWEERLCVRRLREMEKLVLPVSWMSTIVIIVLGASLPAQASSLLSLEEMANIVGGCYSYCKSGYTCGVTQDCDIPLGTGCIPFIGNCTGSWIRPESFSTCAYTDNPYSSCELGYPVPCSKIYDCVCWPNPFPVFQCLATWAETYYGSYYPCR